MLCSHGDVIPDTIAALQRRGCVIDSHPDWRKGTVWTLERAADGQFISAKVWGPPDRAANFVDTDRLSLFAATKLELGSGGTGQAGGPSSSFTRPCTSLGGSFASHRRRCSATSAMSGGSVNRKTATAYRQCASA